MSPSVSVVTATYNYAHYLPEAIESIFAQTVPASEIIIVDDGSTDNTPEVVQRLLRDPRVQYVRTENRGQPAAENRGIRTATGDFVAFLDADDRWMPSKLERQLTLFSGRPEVAVVYSLRQPIDAVGKAVKMPHKTMHRGRVLPQMFRENFVCFSSSVVRRRVFDDVGLFNETDRVSSDYDLWLRVAREYEFDYVDEPLVAYRTGHPSLSRRPEQMLLRALTIMERFLGENGGARLLDSKTIRDAYVETYNHLALARRDWSRMSALTTYLASLRVQPLKRETWKQLGSLMLPESGRRLARRLLGRQTDWRVLQPLDG